MKTAEEKAQQFVDLHLLTSGMSKDNKRIMKKAIVGLLKEQDRDTRHTAIDEVHNLERIPSAVLKKSLVVLDEVEMAIMNTKEAKKEVENMFYLSTFFKQK